MKKLIVVMAVVLLVGSCSLDSGDDDQTQGGKVATPFIFPEGGRYNTSQSISIACATEGATIYYTTNGDTPTRASSKYTNNPIFTLSGTTIKAFAVKDGSDDSDIASETYIITIGGNLSSYANQPWTKFLGGTADDYINDIVIDSQGNIYVTGRTKNSLGGQSNAGKDIMSPGNWAKKM